jgi:uncharacterized damage-inducible protein DinB
VLVRVGPEPLLANPLAGSASAGQGRGRPVGSMVRLVGEAGSDEDGRTEPPYASAEAATLLGFLDYQRETLERKCRGLSDEQLRVVLPPSPITLGGLLMHLACVEDSWFTETVGGQPLPEPWARADFDADPDWDWHSAATYSGDALRALWAERVNRSRDMVKAQFGDGEDAALSQTHPAWGRQDPVSLRWVLAHMIEEYARHNGHADLIRESIDGQTGD